MNITPTIRQVTRTERDITYRFALDLVVRIDEDLTRGICHYRTQAGQLLTTLDEVIRAVEAEDCQAVEETDYRAAHYHKPKPPRRKKAARKGKDVAQVVRRAKAYQAGDVAAVPTEKIKPSTKQMETKVKKEKLTARINYALTPSLKQQAERQAQALGLDFPTFNRVVLAFASKPGGIALLAKAAEMAGDSEALPSPQTRL